MTKALATVWTSHIQDQKKREDFEKLLRNSTLSLGRLKDIVRAYMDEVYSTERKTDAYKSFHWPYYQAHLNGMLQAYGNIDRLLAFTEDRSDDRQKR